MCVDSIVPFLLLAAVAAMASMEGNDLFSFWPRLLLPAFLRVLTRFAGWSALPARTDISRPIVCSTLSTGQPAKQCSRIRPSSATLMWRLGIASAWEGQRAFHPPPDAVTPSRRWRISQVAVGCPFACEWPALEFTGCYVDSTMCRSTQSAPGSRTELGALRAP